MQKRRKLTWKQIKQIIELKTFYIIVLLVLLGTIFLLLERLELGKDFIFEGVFSALGITFITSSTVSLIMELFLRFDLVDFMGEKLLSAMPENISGNTGVNEFYLDRKRIDFKSRWENSKDFMKIIGVSANDILASANFPLIKQRLESDKDFFVQVLLLCPWSITADIRCGAKVYKTKYEAIVKTHSVIMDIENFYEAMKETGIKEERFELRLFDDIPSLSMIIDADIAIVAPFMVIEHGGSSPYYVANNIQTNNCLYELYCNHFDTIWHTAHRIDDFTSMKNIYEKQTVRDNKRVKELPRSYDEWVLKINKVGKKEEFDDEN